MPNPSWIRPERVGATAAVLCAALAAACSADTSGGQSQGGESIGTSSQAVTTPARPPAPTLTFYPPPTFIGPAGDLCDGGRISCGGICIQHESDPHNCGQCGTACARGEVCKGGICIIATPDVIADLTLPLAHARCAPGSFECGGGCVDVRSAAANCGACASACAAGTTCTGGHCK